MVNVSRDYILKLQRRAEEANRNTDLNVLVTQNEALTTTPQYDRDADAFDQPARQSTEGQQMFGAASNMPPVLANGLNDHQEKAARTMKSVWPARSSRESRASVNLSSNAMQSPDQSLSRAAVFPERTGPDEPSEMQDGLSDFYGNSSTLSYVQAMQHSIESGQPATPSPTTMLNKLHPSPDTTPTEPSKPGPTRPRLPRSLADELIASYFRHVHLLYPFLHRPSFQVEYERTWNSNVRQDEEWLALLNLVFALGIRFGQVFGDETTASDEYFGYARDLSPFERLAKPTVQTLQLLLLRSLYYQFTNRSNENWNALGLAIRVATTIGAHVNPEPGQLDAIMVEVRRRCWHGCVVLDSHLALNLGRPTTIPDDLSVLAPTDLDDEYITAHGYAAQPARARSRTAFFVQSVAFCAVMKDVQRSLYPQNSSRMTNTCRDENATPTFSEVVRLDKALLNWYKNVPEFLKTRCMSDDDTFGWIRNVLLCRFLNLRILIHRPFASLWRPSGQPADAGSLCLTPLDNGLYSISVDLCQSTAIKLVGAVSENFTKALPGSWWAEMNYLFTAASVLLAIEHTKGGSQADVSSQTAFDTSLQILQRMREQSSTAATYASMLSKAGEAHIIAQESAGSRPNTASRPITNFADSMSGPIINSWRVSPPVEAPPELEPFASTWNTQVQSYEPWDFFLEGNSMPWN